MMANFITSMVFMSKTMLKSFSSASAGRTHALLASKSRPGKPLHQFFLVFLGHRHLNGLFAANVDDISLQTGGFDLLKMFISQKNINQIVCHLHSSLLFSPKSNA